MVFTGPVQFKYGRSLHKVDLTYIKGTTVMPSKADKNKEHLQRDTFFPIPLLVFMEL